MKLLNAFMTGSSPLSKALMLIVLTLTQAHGAIDFTPIPGERDQEGVIFKHLVFREQNTKISYEYPAGWTYTGGSAGLQLSPLDVTQAQATIEQVALPEPQPLDEEPIKELEAKALSVLPPGNLGATIVAAEENPIRIKGAASQGFTIEYTLHGQNFVTNILFANLEDVQLCFRVVARKDDFEKAFRAFRGSLYTLQWE